MTATVSDPRPVGRVEQHETPPDRRGLWWGLATVVAVGVASLLPLLFNPSYYYAADTSQGAYGNWFHLGSELRAGRWPMLNLGVWGSGNYIAEGQMGLYNPLAWLIGLGASVASDVVVFASVVKISFLMVAALGTYLLARSYRVPPALSALAGTLAPLGGFTLYMDAPSWVTNLMVWALLPWAWWALRRALAGRTPALVLCFAFLIVTIGYVHGTIMLLVVLAGSLLEAALRRSVRQAVTVVVVGVFTGLVALTVFLPGVLSAGVTSRDSDEILNTGFLVLDGTGLASSIIPTVQAQVTGWWGTFAPGPITYVAWALPLFLLADPRRLRQLWPDAVPVFTLLAVVLVFVLGPSDVGPLRYPMRLMPFLTTGLVLLLVLVLARARREVTPRWVTPVVAATGLAATYLAMAQFPTHWRINAVAGVAVVVALVVMVRFLRGTGRVPRALGPVSSAAVFGIAASVALVGIQHHYFDGRETSGANDYPRALSDYQSPLAAGINDGIVVGDPSAIGASSEVFEETLVANTWYLNPNVRMQNVYTTIFFEALAEKTCMNHVGATCPELLDTLFERVDGTDADLVDLLSIDTIQLIKPSLDDAVWEDPPAGWHVAEDARSTATWVRDDPVGEAGGVAWSEPGVKVDVVGRSSTDLELRVVDAPTDGGRVVMSRLAWPGYRVSGADLAEPVDGFLLAVDVPGGSEGDTITVSYRPPLWEAQVATLAAALFLGAAFSAWSLWARGRRQE
ncbi:hypothetical protein [Cellulosimicrobium cellulans]|uniref:hypothetical protein n=1 Tax=Cellulosimicrobium cellulans TaxID=1710 RepID=UPI0008489244|nr:hypothetical protein [Cellulosimicrobium cellulans]